MRGIVVGRVFLQQPDVRARSTRAAPCARIISFLMGRFFHLIMAFL